MRWLLVARKRLDEEGLGPRPARLRLRRGLAARATGRSRGVVAGDVIEHVADQAATLAEAYRVLRPGGRLFLASPNRFSLAPEPHVGVWGVGYLPTALDGALTCAGRAASTSGRSVRSVTSEWARMLRESPFGGGRDRRSPPCPATTSRTSARSSGRSPGCITRSWRPPPGRLAARAVGPLFHVVCEKPPSPAERAPDPAEPLADAPGRQQRRA